MGKPYAIAKMVRILAFIFGGILAKHGVDTATADSLYASVAECLVSVAMIVGALLWSLYKDKKLANTDPPGTVALPITTINSLQNDLAAGKLTLDKLMSAVNIHK
jgi:hypothetical protein